MDSRELREKFIKFFEEKGHKKIESAGLIPVDDRSVLFTTAGMHPLVPYLLGQKHPFGTKLTSVQKCLRTDDILEVGDKSHDTFFEMLGNWSLGDYWKKEAISWSYEFLTSTLKLDPKKLAVTCFEGDQDAPRDEESAEIWRSLGISSERIAFLGKKDNWWGPAAETGPCGPDTEMFYWTGEGEPPAVFDPKQLTKNSTEKWVEIWNDVFMQYNKTAEGKFEPLTQKNVDTGMGLERALAVINNFDEIYRTDIFWPIIKVIEDMNGLNFTYGEKTDDEYLKEGKECWIDARRQFRIIADHIKAATFAINEGVVPSNKEQGYVVRRLIRRAIVKGTQLKIEGNFTPKIAENVFEIYQGVYDFNKDFIKEELLKEETKFRNTLSQGIKNLSSLKEISGKDLFYLYQSFGLPIEISIEEAERQNIKVLPSAQEEFESELKKHQDLSRTASAGMFKGGLAGEGEMETKYHTATHLLLASLRKILGPEVSQKGANITSERIRFDFNYPEKLTPEQIKAVEEEVNKNIAADLPVDMQEMSLEDAKNCGATGTFTDRYGEKVKVYSIGEVSKEICGGPHVAHTGILGQFKITKEEASSAGIRRVKAILE